MNYLNENIDSLNKKLQDGEITAEDLAKETVKNIKETDKKINAWITVDDDAKPAEDLDFAKNKLACQNGYQEIDSFNQGKGASSQIMPRIASRYLQ